MNRTKWSLMLNYINSISPTLPAILSLLKSFLIKFFNQWFLRETSSWYIDVKQCENINMEAVRIFFLRYKVKVGEFMKLFYPCAISRLKLTTIPVNSSSVQSFSWVNSKRWQWQWQWQWQYFIQEKGNKK